MTSVANITSENSHEWASAERQLDLAEAWLRSHGAEVVREGDFVAATRGAVTERVWMDGDACCIHEAVTGDGTTTATRVTKRDAKHIGVDEVLTTSGHVVRTRHWSLGRHRHGDDRLPVEVALRMSGWREPHPDNRSTRWWAHLFG